MSGGRPGHSPVQESGSAFSRAHKDGTRCGWPALAHRRMAATSATDGGVSSLAIKCQAVGLSPSQKGDTCVSCQCEIFKICRLSARHSVAP